MDPTPQTLKVKFYTLENLTLLPDKLWTCSLKLKNKHSERCRDAPVILARAESFGDHSTVDVCIASLAESFQHVTAAEWRVVHPSHFLKILRCEMDLNYFTVRGAVA